MIILTVLAVAGVLVGMICVPVLAKDPTAPMPDEPAPSFHPGLFSTVSPTPTQTPDTIPAVENSYIQIMQVLPLSAPNISYSVIPANETTREPPSVFGFISGTYIDITVNISARMNETDEYVYIGNVTPDKQGLFMWDVPDWAANFTEYSATIN